MRIYNGDGRNYCTVCKVHDSDCEHDLQFVGKGYVHYYASHIEVHDNATCYSLLGVKYFNAKGQDRIMGKPETIRMRIFNDGRITVSQNGKGVMARHLIRKVVLEVLCRDPNAISDKIREMTGKRTGGAADAFVDLYYKARNPTLKDLRIVDCTAFFREFEVKERAKIYQKTRKHGSKEGVTALTGTSNKKLQAIVLDNIGCAKYVKKLIAAGVAADQIVHRCNSYQDSTTNLDRYLVFREMAIEPLIAGSWHAIELGYSIKAAMGCSMAVSMELRDTNMMIRALKDAMPNYVVPQVQLAQLHDRVMYDFRLMQRGLNEEVLGRELPIHSIGDICLVGGVMEIVSAKTVRDLVQGGDKMGICVGSYFRAVLKRNKEIYFVTQNGEPVTCLEVKQGNLVQAKMKRNYLVCNDEWTLKTVTWWASVNDIQLNTTDMGVPHNCVTYIRDVPMPLVEARPEVILPIPHEADAVPRPQVPPPVNRNNDDLNEDLPF